MISLSSCRSDQPMTSWAKSSLLDLKPSRRRLGGKRVEGTGPLAPCQWHPHGSWPRRASRGLPGLPGLPELPASLRMPLAVSVASSEPPDADAIDHAELYSRRRAVGMLSRPRMTRSRAKAGSSS